MATSTVLKLIQSFCREYAQPVPTAIQGTPDAGSMQMRELLQSVGEDVQSKSNWQQCSRLVTWNSVLGKDQGAIETICSENLDYVVSDTFWDLTTKQQFEGPMMDMHWQVLAANASTGPIYFFRIAGGRLQISTSMPAGRSLSLIYKTRNWLLTGGTVPGATITTDTDTSYFSDTLMKKGLRAFWLRMKQMPHKVEMETYENALAVEASQSTMKRTLHMDNPQGNSRPGIMVPSGNWTIP